MDHVATVWPNIHEREKLCLYTKSYQKKSMSGIKYKKNLVRILIAFKELGQISRSGIFGHTEVYCTYIHIPNTIRYISILVTLFVPILMTQSLLYLVSTWMWKRCVLTIYTRWPIKHGRIFLVPWKNTCPVSSSVHWTSQFLIWYHKIMAMFNWSAYVCTSM